MERQGSGWHASWAAWVERELDSFGRNGRIRNPAGLLYSHVHKMHREGFDFGSPAPGWKPPPEPESPPRSSRPPPESRDEGPAAELWQLALADLRVQVTRPTYETWLKETRGAGLTDEEFIVQAPNAFVAEMLKQRMSSLIAQAVERVGGRRLAVRILPE